MFIRSITQITVVLIILSSLPPVYCLNKCKIKCKIGHNIKQGIIWVRKRNLFTKRWLEVFKNDFCAEQSWASNAYEFPTYFHSYFQMDSYILVFSLLSSLPHVFVGLRWTLIFKLYIWQYAEAEDDIDCGSIACTNACAVSEQKKPRYYKDQWADLWFTCGWVYIYIPYSVVISLRSIAFISCL